MKTLNLSTLKLIVLAVIYFFSLTINAQNDNLNTTSRQGFMFEFSLGAGVISLEDSAGLQSFDDSQGAFTFPDFKFGYLLNDKLALTVSMPGMIYDVADFDRHFGGFVPSVQYWVKDCWWIHGGVGLALDSPALYDIKDGNKDWNFGCAVMASSGYEIYKKKNFALNIQSNVFMGRAFLDGDAHRDAVTFNLGLGFSWL
ncbi:hypothetical protein J1D01_05005 [Seonamhaeicola sp. NFXS20]|uniref:hypothetical protein n=1 Tax=Seonamhaeicola sp. NFXS20 TaxID=2816959 RepID=UPI003B8E77E6